MALPRGMTALKMRVRRLGILIVAALMAKLGDWVDDLKVGEIHHELSLLWRSRCPFVVDDVGSPGEMQSSPVFKVVGGLYFRELPVIRREANALRRVSALMGLP